MTQQKDRTITSIGVTGHLNFDLVPVQFVQLFRFVLLSAWSVLSKWSIVNVEDTNYAALATTL